MDIQTIRLHADEGPNRPRWRRRRLTKRPYNRMVVSMTLSTNADQVFAALADATRRDIVLRALAGREGVAELAGHYPMSFAAVQKHVAVLERAGLVTKRRTGRRKVVQTNIEGLNLARGLLDQYETLWRGRVERMAELIDSTEEIEA
jgi:DNA-binding transcriptional ArsR family regulator